MELTAQEQGLMEDLEEKILNDDYTDEEYGLYLYYRERKETEDWIDDEGITKGR